MPPATAHDKPTSDWMLNRSNLRELAPFGASSDAQLDAIIQGSEVRVYAPGDSIIALGSDNQELIYLINGSVVLIAKDGGKHIVECDGLSARSPLAALRPTRYAIDAVHETTCLLIPPDVLKNTKESVRDIAAEDIDFESLLESPWYARIIDDLQTDQLRIPTLPSVATSIRRAMKDTSMDVDRLAAIIETDPAIAVEVLRCARSPLYYSAADIRTVREAVLRIGTNKLANLVTGIAIRSLFQSSSSLLNAEMERLWQHNLAIAATSFALAKMRSSLDPEYALLAGLLHEIGSLVVLGYCYDDPKISRSDQALKLAIREIGPHCGATVLRGWELGTQLVQTALEAFDMDRDSGPELDYCDLVIAAHEFEQMGESLPENPAQLCPPLPACKKLGITDAEILNEVREHTREHIRAAQSLLQSSNA